jgi:DNA-binding FadR family transcriptional regulator
MNSEGRVKSGRPASGEFHRNLVVAAILRGDREGAARAMRDHIMTAHEPTRIRFERAGVEHPRAAWA